VEPDSQGVLRVGSLGVSLDSVVIAFLEGHSPETIQQLYPALSLEEVYGAVAYYLANRNEVDQYLKRGGSSDARLAPRKPANSGVVDHREPASHLGRERSGGMDRPGRILAALTPPMCLST